MQGLKVLINELFMYRVLEPSAPSFESVSGYEKAVGLDSGKTKKMNFDNAYCGL